MKLFALECSAAAASAAVYQDGRLLGEQYLNIQQTHSSTLLPMAQQLLGFIGCKVADMDYFAICRGPGSFTGLRIGIAAVKGLAFPKDTPCIGVSTLEGMAYLLRGFEGTVAAVMDARCRQVYSALFAAHWGEVTRLTEDAAIPLTELEAQLRNATGPIWLVGDGAALAYEALHTGLPDLRLAPEPVRFQHASGIGAAALVHLEEAVPPAALLPSYLRPPHAMSLAERQKAAGEKSV